MNNLVTRTEEGETIIEAKMPSIQEIMEEISIGKTESENGRWNHLTYYDLETYPMDDSYHLGRLGRTSLWADDGRVNLSFLRATTLDEGIEMRLFNHQPHPAHFKGVLLRAVHDILRRHYAPRIEYTEFENGVESKNEVDNLAEISTEKYYPNEKTMGMEFEVKEITKEQEDPQEVHKTDWTRVVTTHGDAEEALRF